ncbi:MAG: 3-hexulose-6-phosphate synthase [Pseudomonadota bacterium]
MKPILQLALDFVDIQRALKAAEAAVEGGVDWIEAGTPLIKSEGLAVVRALRARFPDKTIVADMKIMDAGRIEVEAAAKAGADIVDVLGAASDATILECVEAGKNYGAKIAVDLIAVKDIVGRAKEIEMMGADYITVHCSIDDQMRGENPFSVLQKVCEAVSTPVGVAGGINSETAHQAVAAGACVIIVGGAITKSPDPSHATALLKKAIAEQASIPSQWFKRTDERGIKSILERVSAANVSDALHRSGALKGLRPLFLGAKLVGRAITVRTYPGDWAKPVQAIDVASQGDVIVIDAGGVGPAVWGELATQSALQKGIAGIVVEGAVRDTYEISRMRFQTYARLIMPNAGEPKGFGEIGVPITVGGEKVETGDWIIGDDDGVMRLPKAVAVEYANRAMDVLERENRIRQEIEEGSTLGKVAELLRWEKR